ncbi:tubulin glycylase 3B-like [Teleopsis dalmanni]|uniref:tubulin glycylase 3B-like n=1 Tax=Teleopsis dalmanni TaxID=139649 RepID=UPI0018CC9606|nr:tubulin glycylase 3B-like [Teleopsis dalmanni]XP_037934189.1 tubulin glycylase 3B-like [Teleopsis dalmanni]
MKRNNNGMKTSGNAVPQIRSLIYNLDSELMDLSSKYTVRYSSFEPPMKLNKPSIATCHAYNKTEMQLRSNMYCSQAVDAYRTKKIFLVYGNYNTVRTELLKRGWKEKLPHNRFGLLQQLSEDAIIQCVRPGNDYEKVILSKIMHHFPAFFIWQPKGMIDNCKDVLPHRNRVRREAKLDFSTKIGLIGCTEHEIWFQTDGTRMRYPRFYRIGGTAEERQAFIDDFRQTQCRSFIQYLSMNLHSPDLNIDAENGTVPAYIVTFAVDCLKKYVEDMQYLRLDETFSTNTETDIAEWRNFVQSSNNVIERKAKLKMALKDLSECVHSGMDYISRINKRHPDFKMDGCLNIWIVKPGYQCRGIGIVLRKNLDDILQFSNRSYVVQKYIERPHLIYKTKFDMRLYMLQVITEYKISIWLYKECYLKFSSQEFNLNNLREVVHLTNNSVQRKYEVDINRDKRIPKYNMWTSEQFKNYLKCLSTDENIWDDKVFPRIARILTAAVMSSFDGTVFVPNSFEVYGCDFMLDEEFEPVLLEINATPDLSPSTEVTANLCPKMLKDLVKVVVDLPENSSAPTGLFSLIHRSHYRNYIGKIETYPKVSGAAMPLPRKSTKRKM